MRALYLTLALPLLLTACPRGTTYTFPDPPATLDYGPHPAALGTAVTITGPAQPYTKVGASIFNSRNLTGESYGEVLPNRQARLRLPATPPALGRTGSIQTLIPDVLPLFMPDTCSVNTITPSTTATYSVPEFYALSASYTGQMTGQMSPAPRYTPVVPATVATNATGYLLAGRIVHVDRDVTLTGEMVCSYQQPSDYTLKVNVTLKAGWNVLREQEQGVGTTGGTYAITGGAADYTIEP
ncbi:hypothetical protein [uncultured Deinococcus sp.]|uniref:hypothetical protein n=1 Tax=uncultured Deinococcus sp. TaxID=158789 RepID=UPI0025E7BE8B|nr:hypothetical protein [uncultured Deinococcus sp.]